MGLFGFLRKGKKEEIAATPLPAGETREVGFDSVRTALEQHLAAKMAGERESAEELYDRIKNNLVHIRKLAGELEKKNFESGEKIYAPVNMTKNNYVKKAISLLGSVPAVERFDYAEISDFSRRTGKTLTELMHIPPKQAILLTRYFKKESYGIITLLKETEEKRKAMDSLLQDSALKIAGEIGAGVDSLAELLEKAQDFERHELALSTKIRDKKKELEEKEREREALVAGSESAGFRQIEEELRKLENERSSIAGKLNNELSAIKRPMKKLEHAAASRGGVLDKEQIALFSRISHSPMKVLMQEQGDSLILNALVRLRGLGLKDAEKEHTEELIKKIELGYLSELADKYKWLEGEIAEKKAKFEKSDVPERRKKKEREAESLRHEIAELKKEMERFSKGRAETMEKTEAEKKKLEEALLNRANIRMSIVLGG
jgi:hypothetical protein